MSTQAQAETSFPSKQVKIEQPIKLIRNPPFL